MLTRIESIPHVGLVIPAYNEENRLGPMLEDVRNTFDTEYGGYYDLIVADDGSEDNTAALAESYGATVLRLPHLGKGSAVRNGMLHSTADYRLFMDADGSFKPEDGVRLLDMVSGETDIAIAVRNKGLDSLSSAHASSLRAIGSRVLAGLCERIAPTGLSDTQCGAKAFKSTIAEDLFGRARVDGFAADREVLWLARGYRIQELPCEITPMDGSKVSPLKDGIRLVRDARNIRKLQA